MNKIKPCILMILDGWGINHSSFGNAVLLAKMPFLNMLKSTYPNTQLLCSGEAVGLPEGIMGNSEVGHLNIGAGRVVYQDIVRIDIAIRDKSFFENAAFNGVISKVKANNSSLHLMGLVSEAGVHSQLHHLFALIDLAKKKGLSKVFIHAILDGRDTPPDSGIRFVKELQDYLDLKEIGKIATICGRYYAMDRDNRWDRVEKAFRLYTKGDGVKEKDAVNAVKNAYSRKETDEFVKPVILTDDHDIPVAAIKDNDGFIFFNFRADRTRQITKAFTQPEFNNFDVSNRPKFCEFVTMTSYDEKFTLPIAFPPVHLNKILGQVISEQGLTQLRIAETEKYAHVTYFFNGGNEKSFPNEERCLIPSPRDVPTYDLKPEMSAIKVTDEVISRIESNKYNFIVLNFANLDMVGHTGNLTAAIKACEIIDNCVEKIVTRIKNQNGIAIVTADHGNAEKMMEENGNIFTAHTLNPVPLILVDDSRKDIHLRTGGVLGDIAPTIVSLLGLEQPKEMKGKSLIIKS